MPRVTLGLPNTSAGRATAVTGKIDSPIELGLSFPQRCGPGDRVFVGAAPVSQRRSCG